MSNSATNANRRVVCAANRHRVTKLIVCGPRHYDHIMRSVMNAESGFPYWLNCDQGFVDQWGEFMTREEAWIVAERAGQIRRPSPCHDGKLYSENLY